ncbi:hypothetical protein OAH18_02945 [bacterium]|nr:hypothetical protein [bacterium]
MLDPLRVPTEEDEMAEAKANGGYTADERRTNGNWILFWAAAALLATWTTVVAGAMPVGGAIAITVIVLIGFVVIRAAFASKSAVKLDQNSPGMGKDVHPTTMGTILGWLNNGFTE